MNRNVKKLYFKDNDITKGVIKNINVTLSGFKACINFKQMDYEKNSIEF